jgi:hypothetical protein
MQQRQLRLGDILDDYCPRERRLANHTVVAMVGDEVRLTRCTTCETEHPYKGGKVPRQRKKTPVQAAYDEVLESVKKETDSPGMLVTHTEPVEPAAEPQPAESVTAAPVAADPIPDAEPTAEEIRLHRPLIRASLPRVETQQPARPIPEFTIRQASRQGRFQNPRAARFAKGRGGDANNQGNTRGNGHPQAARHGGRPQGQGHGAPGRPGQGRHAGQHQNSNKKRSR